MTGLRRSTREPHRPHSGKESTRGAPWGRYLSDGVSKKDDAGPEQQPPADTRLCQRHGGCRTSAAAGGGEGGGGKGAAAAKLPSQISSCRAGIKQTNKKKHHRQSDAEHPSLGDGAEGFLPHRDRDNSPKATLVLFNCPNECFCSSQKFQENTLKWQKIKRYWAHN